MTELLYQTNSSLKELQATVAAVEDNAVVLDKTIFYPGGGGQPADQGKIISSQGEGAVLKVKKIGDKVLHTIDGALPKVGEQVICQLDWHRRMLSCELILPCTSSVVLSGVILKHK